MIAELGIESFHGAPIRGNDGKANGVLVVMDDEPMDRGDRRLGPTLELFAARAGAELARIQAEEEIRDSHERLEYRVSQQNKNCCTLRSD